jgi:hypothetical protein
MVGFSFVGALTAQIRRDGRVEPGREWNDSLVAALAGSDEDTVLTSAQIR